MRLSDLVENEVFVQMESSISSYSKGTGKMVYHKKLSVCPKRFSPREGTPYTANRRVRVLVVIFRGFDWQPSISGGFSLAR